MADNKKSSTTAKKLSNKEIREARRKAKLKEEKIPAGMKAEDYADAAFRKKVTIIMGSILIVFIVGVVAVILGAKLKTDNHNKEFERIENEFLAESQEIKQLMRTTAIGFRHLTLRTSLRKATLITVAIAVQQYTLADNLLHVCLRVIM